jgi:hypothetical protein
MDIDTVEPVVNDTAMTTGPVATIDDLLQIREALLKKEADDTVLFNSGFQPDDATLKNALVQWATIGFPSQHILLSVQLNPPPACSDGQVRNFFYYALYLAKLPDMSSLLSGLNTRVAGMNFDFTLVDVNTINLIVSKI